MQIADYYIFVISSSGTITLTLTNLPADYDLRLYKGSKSVKTSQNGGTTSETISYTAAAGTYYARVYGYSGAMNATNCYTLKVQLGTASKGEELITQKISVFPNPVKDVVTVKIPDLQSNANIKVFDMYGRMVMQQNSSQQLTQLNVSKLTSGVYIVRVKNAEQEISIKIIKQ